MFKRLTLSNSSNNFSLRPSSVVALKAIGSLPTSEYKDVEVLLKSGESYTLFMTAQDVTDLSVGLTSYNNGLVRLRKTEIETVKLSTIAFPSGQMAPVTITFGNKEFVVITVDPNEYNNLTA